MTSTDHYSTFRVTPVTAALGAEVDEIDLNASLAEQTRSELSRALSEHLVLFFRDQHIDDEGQLALARCFGEPEVHPIRGALGDPSLLHDIVDSADSKPDRAGWHTDVTYMERPPRAAVLRCEQTPDAGGDTLWANMEIAYDKLSTGMKDYLADLRGFHATDGGFVDYIRRHLPGDAVDKIMEAVGRGASHPIVRTHPETGRKSLFVDQSYLSRIEGLDKDESRCLLEFLASRADDICIQCRFRWTKGAVAVWDERSKQHCRTVRIRATGDAIGCGRGTRAAFSAPPPGTALSNEARGNAAALSATCERSEIPKEMDAELVAVLAVGPIPVTRLFRRETLAPKMVGPIVDPALSSIVKRD